MFQERPVMTRNEQITFVCDMTLAVTQEIASKIDSGVIPEHWDGVQLRQYITDKVRQRCDAYRFMTSADLLKYNNEMITFNL
jgi:hypothetical protein